MPRGDTFLTLRKMKLWAEKYAGHTKKLASSKFRGMTLANTAANIHHFLYSHIQYEMDGALQVLKSPGCTWATRAEGTDCKTYSIFASTILQNLGIKHYFKKIKQPNPNWPYRGIDPGLWSHVYVIIPKDQKKLTVSGPSTYHVIDATVVDNKEVPATEAKLELMSNVSLPHVGLAAPGLGSCSCSKKQAMSINRYLQSKNSADTIRRTAKVALRGLGATTQELSEFEKAFIKFDIQLADWVVNKGLPVSLANQARERLVRYAEKGIEPTIKELFGLETSAGLGSTITAPLLTDINQLPRSTGIFNRGSSNTGGLLDTAKGVLPFVSPAASIVTNIIPKDLFDKTFGAVFANGFNLKCWGAKWNPQRAETEFAKDAELVKQRLQQILTLPGNQLENAINEFWIWFYGLKSTQRNWLNTSAKDCTKDGLKILIGAHDGLAAQSKNTISQVLTSSGHVITNAQPFRKTYPPESTGRHAWTFDVPQYKVAVNQNIGNPTNNTVGSGRGVTVGTRSGAVSRSFVDENGQLVFVDQPNQTQNAGFGWMAVGVIAVVAIGAYAFKGNQNSKGSEAAPNKQVQTSK